MSKRNLALVEEIVVRLQRGGPKFAKDLAAFLKDPALWRRKSLRITAGADRSARSRLEDVEEILDKIGKV